MDGHRLRNMTYGSTFYFESLLRTFEVGPFDRDRKLMLLNYRPFDKPLILYVAFVKNVF